MSAQSIEVDDNNAKKIMDPLKSLILDQSNVWLTLLDIFVIREKS